MRRIGWWMLIAGLWVAVTAVGAGAFLGVFWLSSWMGRPENASATQFLALLAPAILLAGVWFGLSLWERPGTKPLRATIETDLFDRPIER